jgi:DNA polymerase V
MGTYAGELGITNYEWDSHSPNPQTTSMIGLVDCNNFYVSCERKLDPSLEGRPVVVLSNNDGVVISRSNEVKAMGVGMAGPAYKYRDLFKKHNVAVFSANFNYYLSIAKRVMAIIHKYAPEVEEYSVDEAFLNLTGWEWKGLRPYMKQLREELREEVGIPVSVGIATTKTLAKVASELVKKDVTSDGVGDFSVDPDIDAKLRKLPVADVWGIGPQSTKFLLERHIATAYDLKSVSDEWIYKNLHVNGLRTVYELRGISCIEIESKRPIQKSIMRSRSFGRYITSIDELREAVAFFASAAAEALRADGCIARRVGVFIMTNRFNDDPKYNGTQWRMLPEPTSSTQIFARHARALLDSIWRDGYKYNKAGAMITDITLAKNRQPELDHDERIERATRAIEVVDTINTKYKCNVAALASQGTNYGWQSKQEMLSKAPVEYIEPNLKFRFMTHVPISAGKRSM